MYQRKTRDVYSIQQYTGSAYGWEEVNEETTITDARRSAKEYRENQPEYPVRIKKRREPIPPEEFKPQSFYLKWQTQTGRQSVTRYHFDGCGHQQGYHLSTWRARCIESTRRDSDRHGHGYTLIGYATEEEY